VPVPPLVLETEEERRRNNDARSRRAMRLAERNRQAQCKQDSNACSQ